MKYFVGFWFGVCITFTMIASFSAMVKTDSKVIKECESTLPRNQVCELYAKPKLEVSK